MFASWKCLNWVHCVVPQLLSTRLIKRPRTRPLICCTTFQASSHLSNWVCFNCICFTLILQLNYSRLLVRSTSLSPDFNMKIIIETFVALNAELISTKTWPISSHRHQSCFTIESFHVRFEGEGNSSQESQYLAFYQLFQFMDQLCGQVTGSITLNKPAHHQSEEINPLAGERLPIIDQFKFASLICL